MARASRGGLAIGLSAMMMLAAAGLARAEPPPAHESGRVFEVDANVGLSALAVIADGHLQRMADGLAVLALSEQARSAKWAAIQDSLAELGKLNVAALNWFALPDGSYWSVQNGRENGNLSTREYFPKVLAGNVVLGDLVVSKATGEKVAIVAVPVKGRDGVVGVLGASVYLKPLSERIREEMRLGEDLIFFSFDATPRLALVWDPGLIFTNPKELGTEVDRAFTEMQTRDAGVVRYSFHEKHRIVVYRRSAVTGWWYGFGLVAPAMTASAWHDAGSLVH